MAFFQKSVIKKHLKALDKKVVKTAYAKFKDYFHNPETQHNIRELNEEQFQQKFLIELFVNIFGYTINPDPYFNLTTEYKNEKGAKKADGAILQDGKALAVIELKGTDTKDLDKINAQAFNYKNNQTGCIYVITSNFEKLRFFIHNSVDHVEFNLFTITEQEFDLLWLCLSADSLLGGVPLKAKNESLLAEENITKQLYKDYSNFKTDLWQSMVKNSPDTNRLLLFKKTQKLLDRFLFIFFAEDSGLLPPNSISRIVKRWSILQEEDAYKPLYDIFKQYFGYINTGRKGKISQDDIFAYNGGLFFSDEVLENIVIDDAVLHPHVMKLTAYDFQSEVDVNILGHIFENSLNEIENVIAKLEGQDVDKSKTKRKKDGVFYTPKYITKYIVDNTVGKLCEEKKAELGIVDEEYAKGRRKRKKETVKKLDKSIQAYREWLLNISVCDPACGSGAFLNQALEFLIKEHEYIDELQAQLFEESIVFQDVSNHILEKNIYGVDINEESVDIAKLSLWLRTAQRGRKLTSLNNNLKCGNSLIDDPEVAGEKAFNWQKEFPEVFPEKDKKAWHVTCATHNSRYSQRMFDYHVKPGEAVWMSEKDEIIVTNTIANIVKEDNLNIISYNICGDHIHILLVCEDEELPKIVGKIKSVSGRKYNIENGITVPATSDSSDSSDGIDSSDSPDVPDRTRGHVPLSKKKKKYNSLWTQKFGKRKITDNMDLRNVINYIATNRQKHELPENKELQTIIKNMTCTSGQAFRTEYKGGFDVVIGNPPYVRAELLSEFQEYLSQNYSLYNPSGDLFSYFYEKSFKLLKADIGLFGFISNTFDKTTAGISIREYLQTEISFLKYVDFTEVQIFEGATTYPVIITAQNIKNNNSTFQFVKIPKLSRSPVIDIDLHHSVTVEQKSLEKSNWSFKSKSAVNLVSKLKKNKAVREIYGKCNRGIVTGFNEAFIVDLKFKEKVKTQSEKDAGLIKKLLEGKDLSKWCIPDNDKHIIFSRRGLEIEQYQVLKSHFEKFRLDLTPRISKEETRGRKPGRYKWFEIQDSVDYYKNFEKPKIVFPNLQNSNKFSFDETGAYINAPAVILPTNDKFLLSILNSKLVWYFLTNICVVRSGGYIEVKPQYFEQIPIPEIKNQEALEAKTDSIIAFTSKFQKVENNFIKYLQSQFNIEKLSKKLQNWHELDFGEFIKELNKAIKKGSGEKLSKKDELEWMEFFEEKKAEAQTLKSEIDRIDKEIDQMVYKLYGLTEEEIRIVEKG